MASNPLSAKLTDDEKLVIVPDACTLAYWSAPIPERYFRPEILADPEQNAKRPKHFYDLLKYLPKAKVKGVDILDIIGAETLGRNAKGELIDPHFNERPKAPDYDALAKQVYSGERPFRVVETPQGKALIEVHAQVHTLNDKIADYLKMLPPTEAKGIEKKVAKQLREARKEVSAHRGENLIKDYLLTHPNPTFFISDEKGARQQVKEASAHNQHGCIYVDNTVGFLEKITGYDKSGDLEPDPNNNILVQKCGFKNLVRPKVMFLHMLEYDRGPHAQVSVPPSSYLEVPSTLAGSKTPTPLGGWFTR